jgi:hypothetical protein
LFTREHLATMLNRFSYCGPPGAGTGTVTRLFARRGIGITATEPDERCVVFRVPVPIVPDFIVSTAAGGDLTMYQLAPGRQVGDRLPSFEECVRDGSMRVAG